MGKQRIRCGVPIYATETEKRCYRCLEIKPIEEFYKRKTGIMGRTNFCKSCKALRVSVDLKAKTKCCGTCLVSKPLCMFDSCPGAYLDHSSECKECRSYRVRARKYNVSVERLHEIESKCGGQCVICGAWLKSGRRGKHLDHDHLTGKVRGMICGRCNLGLKPFENKRSNVYRVLDYLGLEIREKS